MLKLPWKRGKLKHEEVEQTLEEHTRHLEMLARRLRRLESELGLTPRPELREVNGR